MFGAALTGDELHPRPSMQDKASLNAQAEDATRELLMLPFNG